MKTLDVLAHVRGAAPRLSPSEGRVARSVLESPADVMRASISALARDAAVSEPTVARFCRSIGFDGFASFKLALAQSLGRGHPFVSAAVAADDPPEAYGTKIVRASIDALEKVEHGLDPAAIATAVDALRRARQILIMGLGGSGPVAQDAQHKISQLGIPTTASTDPILQRMAASVAEPEDVVLAISVTGRTRPLVENAALAAEAGARVIALTAPVSPLAALADPLLAVLPSEDTELHVPMGSRLAHLALVDVLATGLVLAGGAPAVDRLARLKASLAGTRLPV